MADEEQEEVGKEVDTAEAKESGEAGNAVELATVGPTETVMLAYDDKEKSELETGSSETDKLFVGALLAFEVAFMVIFLVATQYSSGQPHWCDSLSADEECADESLHQYFVFQDVHTMVFVGFGFLMTFLRNYAFSSVGFNMLVSAFAIQWTIICFGLTNQGFGSPGVGWGNDLKKVHIDMEQLLDADLGAAVVLISFGAVLGRLRPLALLIMALIEIPVYSVNFYLCSKYLAATDVGGSIVIHTFGAYFGLAVSYALGPPKQAKDNKSMYHSDLFAMVGTLFLWLYWPSFNGFFAPAAHFHKERAFVNTVLALSACTVTTFAASKWVGGKLDMVHIQNSTLAGGVAVGAAADLYLTPGGALAVGIFAAGLSVLGYAHAHEWLQNSRLQLWDTCGVHYLHGIPGVVGGLISALAIAFAKKKNYAEDIFPDNDHNFQKQAGMQVAAVALTVAVALSAGLVTGFVLKCLADSDLLPTPTVEYHDNDQWEVPEEDSKDRGLIPMQQLKTISANDDVAFEEVAVDES